MSESQAEPFLLLFGLSGSNKLPLFPSNCLLLLSSSSLDNLIALCKSSSSCLVLLFLASSAAAILLLSSKARWRSVSSLLESSLRFRLFLLASFSSSSLSSSSGLLGRVG